MGSESGADRLLCKMYKRSLHHQAIYFFVKGAKSVFPTLTFEQIVYPRLYKELGITVDDLPVASMEAICARMDKEIVELSRKK